ncbi:MAG: DUF1801 domain-containing protein [Phycisphaerales bacterium]
MVATKSADPDAFMRDLDHPHKELAQAVRRAIRAADKSLVEGVKWNAPSFQHHGDDRITLNLSAKDCVRVIFHCGAKPPKTKPKAPIVDQESAVLEWPSNDRAIMTFPSAEVFMAHKKELAEMVKKWIEATA